MIDFEVIHAMVFLLKKMVSSVPSFSVFVPLEIDHTFILMYTPASVLIFVVSGKVISSIKEDEYFDQPSFSLMNILISQALI